MPVDPGLTFEETGIDYLCVDELHGYKNLVTVSEIPDANITSSKRAFDLYAKATYLRRTTQSGRVMCANRSSPWICAAPVDARSKDAAGLGRVDGSLAEPVEAAAARGFDKVSHRRP